MCVRWEGGGGGGRGTAKGSEDPNHPMQGSSVPNTLAAAKMLVPV